MNLQTKLLKMESLLKSIKIETLHSDKANCDFKKVTFGSIKLLGTREVKTNAAGTRNLWPDHEVTLADGSKTLIKGDIDYATIMIGDLFDGTVHAFETVPYQIDGRLVNQYKCVVFATENPLVVAARNLRVNNSAPLVDDGNGNKVAFTIGQPAGIGSNGAVNLNVKETPEVVEPQ